MGSGGRGRVGKCGFIFCLDSSYFWFDCDLESRRQTMGIILDKVVELNNLSQVVHHIHPFHFFVAHIEINRQILFFAIGENQ